MHLCAQNCLVKQKILKYPTDNAYMKSEIDIFPTLPPKMEFTNHGRLLSVWESSMNDKKSFRATLPGILTGFAAVITAIGTIIAIFYQGGVDGEKAEKEFGILAAPIPEHPACGSVVRSIADTEYLVLNWLPVDGASTYTVEVDCFGCGQYPDKWHSQSGTPWHIKPGMGRRTPQNPIYSSKVHMKLHQAGGTSLRWRVWAVDAEGRDGKKSAWCQLAFTGSFPSVRGGNPR
ncbi:MAG: hypothetical protein BM485_12720 [Desulfobulbaceae bacterium DB1]|nr:MAG: hypothetical protein BM485_12720 [Desulfobulbaceae bacterium DB1]